MRNILSQILGSLRYRRRRVALIAVVGIAMVAAPVAVSALTSPRTWVHEPANDSNITGDLVVEGEARHNQGVASIDVVVKNLDESTYWNGSGWQTEWTVVQAMVDNVGAQRTTWSYTVPEESMESGNFRARAFARSVEGNGDSHGGDINEFFYNPALNRDLYHTEIVAPVDGNTIAGAITVAGTCLLYTSPSPRDS